MSEQLKLCPYCGGSATLHKVYDSFFVKCFKCDMGDTKLEREGVAIKRWNNRTSKKMEIWKDDECEGFAAFCAGSSTDRPMIVLNVGSTLLAAIENNIDPKELIIENLMHEFGHFIEELMKKEFDEELIEKCIQSYRDKYAAPNEGT